MTNIPNNRVWDDMGFWKYDCGCIQFQDGWETCDNHKAVTYDKPKSKLNTDLMFSSKSDEWGTPDSVFNPLNDEFHFTLDAAANYLNNRVGKYYGFHRDCFFDALKQIPSGERIWLNPPYSRIKDFMEWIANNRANNTWVVLLPARTDTKWFHSWCWDQDKHQARYHSQLRFYKGRIKFTGGTPGGNSAPFPSMLWIAYSPC